MLCLLSQPVVAAPPRGASVKARPGYFMVVRTPALEDGLDAGQSLPLARALRAKLSQSSALSLGKDEQSSLSPKALKRHLRRLRMAGLAAIPQAKCPPPKKVGKKTIVRCSVSLLLVTLRNQSMVSLYGCEAEVKSFRPSLSREDLNKLRQDVLAIAADGAAEDLARFLETNRPGTGRLPRRGR